MRDFHRDRRAVKHNDLVAPVELVGFAQGECQWHKRARDRGTVPLPTTGITTHRVVAASIATFAQGLENPDQRQPLSRGLRIIGFQQAIKLLLARPDPRQRLRLAPVAELRRRRERTTFRTTFRDTRNSRQISLIAFLSCKYARRIFAIASTVSIPSSASRNTESHREPQSQRGPFGRRSPPKRGPFSMPNHI